MNVLVCFHTENKLLAEHFILQDMELLQHFSKFLNTFIISCAENMASHKICSKKYKSMFRVTSKVVENSILTPSQNLFIGFCETQISDSSYNFQNQAF